MSPLGLQEKFDNAVDMDEVLISVGSNGNNIVLTDEREFDSPDEVFENLCKSSIEQIPTEIEFSPLAAIGAKLPKGAKKGNGTVKPRSIQESRPRAPPRARLLRSSYSRAAKINGKDAGDEGSMTKPTTARKRVTKTAIKKLVDVEGDSTSIDKASKPDRYQPRPGSRRKRKTNAVFGDVAEHQQNAYDPICLQSNQPFAKMLQDASSALKIISSLDAELNTPLSQKILKNKDLHDAAVKKYRDKQIEIFKAICETEPENRLKMLRVLELSWNGRYSFQNFKACLESKRYRDFLLANLQLLYQAIIDGPESLNLGDFKSGAASGLSMA
ncbi:hypothetical protein N7495_006417 [Penicillium taxi]|uniref:uncharacterized protein n=1 Tax=Penicillium taxi TaxID=168475 RepID=UPI0025451FA5|nr:uncharacterized protein N7495_006417 [Penicillium taxi]KAJ5894726.1 hypothetical protein N7495_006417 [Penicillium taxi]